jgi:pilus assembly protein CpaF
MIETEPMFVRRHERLERLAGMPPRPERFARKGIDLHRLLSADASDDDPVPERSGRPG